MAITTCPECDGKLSSLAPACPHCGMLQALNSVPSESSGVMATPPTLPPLVDVDNGGSRHTTPQESNLTHHLLPDTESKPSASGRQFNVDARTPWQQLVFVILDDERWKWIRRVVGWGTVALIAFAYQKETGGIAPISLPSKYGGPSLMHASERQRIQTDLRDQVEQSRLRQVELYNKQAVAPVGLLAVMPSRSITVYFDRTEANGSSSLSFTQKTSAFFAKRKADAELIGYTAEGATVNWKGTTIIVKLSDAEILSLMRKAGTFTIEESKANGHASVPWQMVGRPQFID